MIGIYKITSPSGKVYIGQSWNIEDRFRRYRNLRCKTQRKIYSSLIKYGVNEHSFEIVHELPNDVKQEILDNYEILYWKQYISCGINMMNIREPGKGGKLSEETKQKLRDGDHSYKVGIKQSNETIEKRISKTRGKKRSEQQRENISLGKKGKKLSFEHVQKLKEKNIPQELRERWSKIKLGKKMSDETKLKMSEAAKSAWAKRRKICL
mgnify:CR=1 FL=1